MTVAPNEVEQVVQAVRAVQDGNTPNAERNKFTQVSVVNCSLNSVRRRWSS